LLIIPVLLLVANGYAACVLYTFVAGPRDTARITHCVQSSSGGGHCDGTWSTGSGDIADARQRSQGTTVPIRLGPLGAYLDDPVVLGVRLIVPGVVDFGSLAGFLLVIVLKRRMAAVARELLDAPGADLVLLVRGSKARYPDGRDFAVLRSGTAYDADGVPLFWLGSRDTGSGEPSLSVLDRHGQSAGMIRREHRGQGPTFVMTWPAGQLLGTAGVRDIWGRSAITVVVSGTQVARVASVGRDWVVRLDRPVDQLTWTMILAFTFDIVRLTTTRAARRGSIALGPGYGS
jgi:hypothetical protein